MQTNMEEEFEETKPRQKVFEPITRFDYCKVLASVIKKPVGYVLNKTRHWRMDWYYQVASECKLRKDHISKVKYIHWFIREAQSK